VRDGILGGRPSDIDVWLPSNISVADQEDFRRLITNGLSNAANITCVFSGPGALTNGPEGAAPAVRNVAEGDNPYGDVNNHWVFEVNYDDLPSVNFMRSMTPWTNPQDFFNGLMRAFDIDQCMYFIGYMPGQQQINSVIMPQHLADRYVAANRHNEYGGNLRAVTQSLASFQMNELYWNQYRLNLTSRARIDARMDKMCGKYLFRTRSVSELNAMGHILPIDSIVATAVPLRLVVKQVNRNDGQGIVPVPTLHNRQPESQRGVAPTPNPWAAVAGMVRPETFAALEARVTAAAQMFVWDDPQPVAV